MMNRLIIIFIITFLVLTCENPVTFKNPGDRYLPTINCRLVATTGDDGTLVKNIDGFFSFAFYSDNPNYTIYFNDYPVDYNLVYKNEYSNDDIYELSYQFEDFDFNFDTPFHFELQGTNIIGTSIVPDTFKTTTALPIPAPFEIIEANYTNSQLYLSWSPSADFDQYYVHIFSTDTIDTVDTANNITNNIFTYSDFTTDTSKVIDIDYSFDTIHIYILAINGPMFHYNYFLPPTVAEFFGWEIPLSKNTIIEDWYADYFFSVQNISSSRGLDMNEGFFNTIFYDKIVLSHFD